MDRNVLNYDSKQNYVIRITNYSKFNKTLLRSEDHMNQFKGESVTKEQKNLEERGPLFTIGALQWKLLYRIKVPKCQILKRLEYMINNLPNYSKYAATCIVSCFNNHELTFDQSTISAWHLYEYSSDTEMAPVCFWYREFVVCIDYIRQHQYCSNVLIYYCSDQTCSETFN